MTMPSKNNEQKRGVHLAQDHCLCVETLHEISMQMEKDKVQTTNRNGSENYSGM